MKTVTRGAAWDNGNAWNNGDACDIGLGLRDMARAIEVAGGQLAAAIDRSADKILVGLKMVAAPNWASVIGTVAGVADMVLLVLFLRRAWSRANVWAAKWYENKKKMQEQDEGQEGGQEGGQEQEEVRVQEQEQQPQHQFKPDLPEFSKDELTGWFEL